DRRHLRRMLLQRKVLEVETGFGVDLPPHMRGAHFVKTEELCRAAREIDDTAAVERSAVVHPHFKYTAVIEIGNAYHGRQRQGRMRGADVIHVEALAIGGALALEVLAIPGRDAFLDVAIV